MDNDSKISPIWTLSSVLENGCNKNTTTDKISSFPKKNENFLKKTTKKIESDKNIETAKYLNTYPISYINV